MSDGMSLGKSDGRLNVEGKSDGKSDGRLKDEGTGGRSDGRLASEPSSLDSGSLLCWLLDSSTLVLLAPDEAPDALFPEEAWPVRKHCRITPNTDY